MACSSCGRRYSARKRPTSPSQQQVRRAPVGFRNPNKKAVIVADPTEQAQGMIQPDPPAGIVIPAPDYAVEPATGIPLSVILTGECPENSLGETTLAPITTGDKPEQYWEGMPDMKVGKDD